MHRDNTPKSGGRRWYDRYPDIASAFAQIKTMPEDYQTLFGQVIFSFYENLSEKKKLSKTLLSLGADRALGLYNTRSKRRQEDEDPLLFKSMTILYMIEEPQRRYIAERISTSIHCLEKYSTACKKKYRQEAFYEVKNLFMVSLEEGMEAGKAYLRSLDLLMEFKVNDEEKTRKVSAAKMAFKRNTGGIVKDPESVETKSVSEGKEPSKADDLNAPEPSAEDLSTEEARRAESLKQAKEDMKLQ